MARIDTNKIAGYSAMTAEEKLAALESLEIEDNASEIDNYKKMISKANTEAADWKRKHNALLSEDEKAKAERDAEFQAMKSKVAELEREKTVATYTASFASMGYKSDVASRVADALADGKMEEVFAYIRQHSENREKELRAEILKTTPTPSQAGGVDKPLTAEEIMAINDPVERQAKIAENINLFK